MVAMVSPRRHKAFLLSAGSVSPRLLPGLSLLLVYFYRAFSSLAFFIMSLSTPQHHPDPGKVEKATGSGSYLEYRIQSCLELQCVTLSLYASSIGY